MAALFGDLRRGNRLFLNVRGLEGVPLAVEDVVLIKPRIAGRTHEVWTYRLTGKSSPGAPFADDNGDLKLTLRYLQTASGVASELLLFRRFEERAFDQAFMDDVTSQEMRFWLHDLNGAYVAEYARVDEIWDCYEASFWRLECDGDDKDEYPSVAELEYWDFWTTAHDESGEYTEYLLVEVDQRDGATSLLRGREIDFLAVSRDY